MTKLHGKTSATAAYLGFHIRSKMTLGRHVSDDTHTTMCAWAAAVGMNAQIGAIAPRTRIIGFVIAHFPAIIAFHLKRVAKATNIVTAVIAKVPMRGHFILTFWRIAPALTPITIIISMTIYGHAPINPLIVFATIVYTGLLGEPNMFILGNGSYSGYLKWNSPSSEALLPQPWVISVSVWYYRVLMLLWALWLAHSLVNWLKWGWAQMVSGTSWKKMKVKKSN